MMKISIITLVALIAPFCSYGQSKKTPRLYYENPTYIEQTDYYSVFHGDHQIVMLGNSLTQRMHWNELLNGYDVVNRGIGSDVSAGLVHRTETVINCHPKIVFIECGVNDIAQDVTYNEFIKNLDLLLNAFKSNNIEVVLFDIIHTTSKYPNSANFNLNVNIFNKGLDSLTAAKSITRIDLNKKLSIDNYLKPEYAENDGIHLMSKAYILWKDEILKCLTNRNIHTSAK